MKKSKALFVVIALLSLSILAAPVRRAVSAELPESNFNLNDNWHISWGVRSAAVYANSVLNYFRVQIGGGDILAVTSTGVGIGTDSPTNALSVAGNMNVTGNSTVAGTLTTSGALTASFPIASTTTINATSYPVGQPIWVEESVAGSLVTNAYNLGVSTANSRASCVYVAISTQAIQLVPPLAGSSCNQ